MSLSLYDDSLQNEVSNPVAGRRYVLKRTVTSTPTNRTFSSLGAVLVQPPAIALPPPGQWNPSGDAAPPIWMLPFYDAYAIQFTTAGNVQVSVGSEQAQYDVAQGPAQQPEPDRFSVKVLQFDAAWLHTVFVCDISYSGTSNVVLLRASDVGTGRILAADIESDGTHTFWCEYDDATGDALVHVSPAPAGAITVRAVVIGDTR